MPDEYTRADAIQVRLTGAAAHNGAQAVPDDSLGKHQSSTCAEFLGVVRTNAIANVTIKRVHGANGTGAGTLTATGNDELKWTPPGGTQGAGVTIANGETKLLEGGNGEYEKCIVVSRTAADNLTGTETTTLASVFNNTYGFDNITSAEAAAGDLEYRCVSLYNASPSTVKDLIAFLGTLGSQRISNDAQLGAAGAGTVGTATDDLSDWPATGWCRIETAAGVLREIVYYSSRTATTCTVPAAGRERLGTTAAAGAADDKIYPVPGVLIAKEEPDAQPDGAYTDKTVAGEGSKPAGLTWRSAISATGDVVDIGDVPATNIFGLWIEYDCPAGMVADTGIYNFIIRKFDAA